MHSIPTNGKKYITFEDGKIKPSRRHIVTIDQIIPYSEIDEETLEQWITEV